ncbi:MAG: hypothetical protein J6Y89_01015 [Lachnospiraceae bacterium]|nr:hypothetical protein [Lachnospiraceae bacterium]
MVYSEVYNMMVSPEDFIGKTVKMKGPFAYYHDEEIGVFDTYTEGNYTYCTLREAKLL